MSEWVAEGESVVEKGRTAERETFLSRRKIFNTVAALYRRAYLRRSADMQGAHSIDKRQAQKAREGASTEGRTRVGDADLRG